MTGWSAHLAVMPVALPMLAAAFLLLFNEDRRRLKAIVTIATVAALVVVSALLLQSVSAGSAVPAWVYVPGNWPTPFAITLVVDRLSAMMLVLSSILSLGTLLFSLARWAWAGPRFLAFFLLLVAGVNGALLTGDLFNLFVFFEVMLAASYGLLLHGSGEKRVRMGLAYVAVNLTASMLFLIGVSLVYGATGTLNMADLARRLSDLPPENQTLFAVASAVLGTAFLVKASMWPLGFWLPRTYAAASAPAAAVFAILSKVGVYVVLRLSLLLFGTDAGAFAGFGADWLFVGGILTVLFGTAGAMAARNLPYAAGCCVMISSGTVLAALGFGTDAALGGALFYMAGSILAGGALFLLAEILEREAPEAALAADARVFADEYEDPFGSTTVEENGPVIPAAIALASAGFLICGLLLAGIPPFAGFIGKLTIFLGALPREGSLSGAAWTLIAVLTLSSFGVLMTLLRFGVAYLWTPGDGTKLPVVRIVEFSGIATLLLACILLTLWSEKGLAYADGAVSWLRDPGAYVRAVMEHQPWHGDASPGNAPQGDTP
ncbi:monovalent cation/H+ antiporter subunit D [Mesorhizobium sp. RP14(2022)]|uniref:Monovalent cation/H+ antiporter subunit D n=1 Tax=Mesorhizobium liriopis TaxID=2953882 RepID=A0ABT1C2G9_9HYPH|nr:monovalent cation/H+ antiporter subunit D [Mesorhizobium liriopis]MCO6049015.1 monovalent cation/H+ antiporter subunit D [Mesorhizobium liriopis]